MYKRFALLFALLLSAMPLCTPQLKGPCYNAMDYRKDAERTTGIERAKLLGRADAEQAKCDQQAEEIEERNRRNAPHK